MPRFTKPSETPLILNSRGASASAAVAAFHAAAATATAAAAAAVAAAAAAADATLVGYVGVYLLCGHVSSGVGFGHACVIARSRWRKQLRQNGTGGGWYGLWTV